MILKNEIRRLKEDSVNKGASVRKLLERMELVSKEKDSLIACLEQKLKIEALARQDLQRKINDQETCQHCIQAEGVYISADDEVRYMFFFSVI